MEYIELWVQLKSHLVSLSLKLSNGKDEYIYLAYLVLTLFKLDSKPVILYILFCSISYELLIVSGDAIDNYFILSSIACSYVTMYYYRNKNRACIGLALMTFYMFLMGQEAIINAISQQFYNSLYDSYELCISAIHIFIITLFIKWRRVFNSLAQFFHDARSGANGVNYLFNVL